MFYSYKYPRPSVTVDCVIFLREPENTKVLLIKRKKYPFKDKWAFPGGFIEMDEDLENSAERELEEETGLKNINLSQFITAGTPGRDPRGRTISVIFVGFTDKDNCFIIPNDDASEGKWVPFDNIPVLAFDHNEILKRAINSFFPDFH